MLGHGRRDRNDDRYFAQTRQRAGRHITGPRLSPAHYRDKVAEISFGRCCVTL
jgi:hypothetical protein